MSLWRTAVLAVLGDPTGDEDDWQWLDVRTDGGDNVARRRFAKVAEAEQARERFVHAVSSMSDEEYEAADWQHLLDHV